MKKHQGSAEVVALVCLVAALLFALGFIFWQNFVHKEPVAKEYEVVKNDKKDANKPADAPAEAYTLANAVAGVNAALKSACGGAGTTTPLEEASYVTVNDGDAYQYQNGKSRINTGLMYVEAQFGCGGSGSMAWLKRAGNTWTIVDESAVSYPLCSKIRGQGFPSSVVAQCMPSDSAADPINI